LDLKEISYFPASNCQQARTGRADIEKRRTLKSGLGWPQAWQPRSKNGLSQFQAHRFLACNWNLQVFLDLKSDLDLKLHATKAIRQ